MKEKDLILQMRRQDWISVLATKEDVCQECGFIHISQDDYEN